MKDETPRRCFMDGVDWQYHLEADMGGTKLYPTVEDLHEDQPHIKHGGCGVVEVEVRFIRWVDKQDL